MGGNALSVPTRRYEKSEYFKLVPEVLNKIKGRFADVHVVQAYKNKDSFGDMDVLVKAENVHFNVGEMIQEVFQPNQIERNTSVYSFDYKEFQIDLILVKPKFWETSIVYYSFNDLGNLMGRIANRMGLKYGHFGLAYKHTHNGRGYGDLVISQDLPKVFKFLGFDWKRYAEGFDELEDVFQYVISSEYFTPQLFAYENLDHQNRTRNVKRKTYQAFLDYLETNKDSIPVDEDYVHYKKETNMQKRDWIMLDKVDAFFPKVHAVKTIEAWNLRIQRKEEVSKKFNGKLIIDKYGLEGEKLGAAINKFKESFKSDTAYDDFILSNDLSRIWVRFEGCNLYLKEGISVITLDDNFKSEDPTNLFDIAQAEADARKLEDDKRKGLQTAHERAAEAGVSILKDDE